MDVVLGGVVPYVHANEVVSGERLFDGEKTPLLAAWLERFGELDAARVVLPDVDRAVAYVRMIHAKNAAKGGE
jgi:glutathione S-transferase